MKEEIVLQREEGETGKRAWEEIKWKELGTSGTEGKTTLGPENAWTAMS